MYLFIDEGGGMRCVSDVIVRFYLNSVYRSGTRYKQVEIK